MTERRLREGRPWYPLPWLQAVLAAGYRLAFHRPLAPPETPRIVFAIPLVGRAQASDWDNVCARLDDTLSSIDAQGVDERLVILCGQDCPPGYPRDARDIFLTAPPFRASRLSGLDKERKMKRIARAMPAIAPGFSYVMWLDADDILHPRLSTHILGSNNGRGYLVDRGWLVGPRGGVAPLDAAPGRYAFWEYCGSCAITAVDTDRMWFPSRYLTRFAGRHHIYDRMAEAHGYPLEPIPFPAVLYLFNHGGNTGFAHGRSGGKQEYMEKHVLPPPERRRVLAEFNYVLPRDRSGCPPQRATAP